jgi:hypothetical protein
MISIMSRTRLTTSPAPPLTEAAPQHATVHRHALTVERSLETFLTSSSSTLSRNKDPRSFPVEPTSASPPLLPLTVDGRRCRVEAVASLKTHRYGAPPPSSSCPVRHPINARSCVTGVGAPPQVTVGSHATSCAPTGVGHVGRFSR